MGAAQGLREPPVLGAAGRECSNMGAVCRGLVPRGKLPSIRDPLGSGRHLAPRCRGSACRIASHAARRILDVLPALTDGESSTTSVRQSVG